MKTTSSCVNVWRFIHANPMPLAAVVGLVVAAACAAGGGTIVDPSAVEGVSIDPTSVTIVVGGPAQTVRAMVVVIHNASPTVTWTSSDPSVARVAASGDSAAVTGRKVGTATITATSTANQGEHADAAVTVTAPVVVVATISVSAHSSSMNLLSTMQAQAAARDASGDVMQGVTFSWTSSNPLVATVSKSGLIASLLVGTAKITASSGVVTSNAFTVNVHP